MSENHELRFLRYQILNQATWNSSTSKYDLSFFNAPFTTNFFGNMREAKDKVMEYLHSAFKETCNRLYIDVDESGHTLQTDYLGMGLFDIMIDEQFYCYKVSFYNNSGVPAWDIIEIDPMTPIVFTNI